MLDLYIVLSKSGRGLYKGLTVWLPNKLLLSCKTDFRAYQTARTLAKLKAFKVLLYVLKKTPLR